MELHTRLAVCLLLSCLATASAVSFAVQPSGATDPKETSVISIAHAELRLQADRNSGTISLFHKNSPLLSGATATIGLTSETIKLSAPRFDRTASTSGSEMILRANVTEDGLDAEWRINLTGHAEATFCLTITNSGVSPLVLTGANPLATEECHFPTGRHADRRCKVLTNGRMYYDPGRLIEFGHGTSEPIDSLWNAAFHDPQTSTTLIAGFLDCDRGEGHILAAPPTPNSPSFALSACTQFGSLVTLAPGGSVTSGRFLLMPCDDGQSGLESYADRIAQTHPVRLNPPINGWCSWFITYGNVNEAEVLRNAEFVARELKPYGMEWIQIDDGYQRAFGDWESEAPKFPNGMKGAADRIRALGLRPGIWLAPFALSKTSPVAREHPEWLARRADGQPQEITPDHQAQAQYILDSTHPGAREWLRGVFRRISIDFGYDFIKTDFVEWTILAVQRFHKPEMSTMAAYRDAVGVMREAIGSDRHLLDCGPGPAVVGLIDSMRIELDRPVPENPLWDQYAGHYNSTGPAVGKRYYFHGRTWINDADHIRLAGLTLDQGRAAATITALSGGNMISGDRLYDLDPERLSILRRVLPSYSAHAERRPASPIDLFETDSPELFLMPGPTFHGQQTIVAQFNWGSTTRTETLSLQRLGLVPNLACTKVQRLPPAQSEQVAPGKWLAHDFWRQEPVPVTDGHVTLVLPPTSVRLLSLQRATGKPQVIGTDRHFSQGGVEFDSLVWDDDRKQLKGVALGSPQMEWTLTVHLPEGFSYWDSEGFESVVCEPKAAVLRAHLRFTSNKAQWMIRFQ